MCRRFICADLQAWVLLLLRRGGTIDQVFEVLPAHAAALESATYERKWVVGISQCVDYFSAGFDKNAEWVQGAWTESVEKAVADYISEVLPELPRATIARQPPSLGRVTHAHRERVEKFMLTVLFETGARISKEDIWRAAGYTERTEFQKFQRGEGTPTAIENFDRVLCLVPKAFTDLRAKQKQHQHIM